MKPSRQLALSLLLVVLAHGAPAIAAVSRATAVVADIGPGTNPYHQAFRRPTWTEHPCTVIPGFSCDTPALNLTFGADYAADLAADRATWASYRPGTLYWVPHTNLLLLTTRSFVNADGTGIPDGHVDATGTHGVGTSGAVSAACPDCYVLVVQDAASGNGEGTQYVVDHLPWVDFITNTSFPGSNTEGPGYAWASKAFVDSGRLQFVGSGNFVVYPLLDELSVAYPDYNLPPWVTVVGGAIDRIDFADGSFDCRGIDPDASKPSDFVGDFAQNLPTPETTNDDLVLTGTSFATPQVAARFAETLRKLRAALGDTRAPGKLWAGAPRNSPLLKDGALTGAEMYQLMASVASYFKPRDYNPLCEPEFALHGMTPPQPAPLAPWSEMGWGFPLAGDTDRAVQVLLGQSAAPTKPPNGITYMQEF